VKKIVPQKKKLRAKEYKEGHEAHQDFERVMETLFRAPKVTKMARIRPLSFGLVLT
jgi:hypothetical protein